VAVLTRKLMKTAPKGSGLPLFRNTKGRPWKRMTGVVRFGGHQAEQRENRRGKHRHDQQRGVGGQPERPAQQAVAHGQAPVIPPCEHQPPFSTI